MRIRELRRKEVINITDGGRLGFVGDVDLRIPWDSIQRIGDDIILIDKPAQHRDPALERRRRKKF